LRRSEVDEEARGGRKMAGDAPGSSGVEVIGIIAVAGIGVVDIVTGVVVDIGTEVVAASGGDFLAVELFEDEAATVSILNFFFHGSSCSPAELCFFSEL
jgi:hypothetical protein